MNTRTKISLIIWWIITFIGWWGIFVFSLLNNNTTAQSTNIIQIQNQFKNNKSQNPKNTIQNNTQERQKPEQNKNFDTTWENQNQNLNTTTSSLSGNNQNVSTNQKKSPYPNLKNTTFTILAPENLVSKLAWKIFNYKFKKNTWWKIKLKFYQNEIDYNKDLIYKIVTKSDKFDLAIIPAYWYNQIQSISKSEFKLNNNFNISSLFDYNFSFFLKDNIIKAIPFGIDPIIWYTNQNISSNVTLQDWKSLIINSPNRLTPKWKIQTMPLFLWYDKNYIRYIKTNWKSLFPVFDFILKYYIVNNSEQAAKLIKDFGNSIIYKTFDFGLTQGYFIWYKKYHYCKKYEKYCLLLSKKSNLVYGFYSDKNWFLNNWIKIFKNFRIFVKKLKKVALPIANFQAEYPARWWIIIINPNSKNLSKIWRFIQTYIIMWQKNKLPFYKNLISPFVKNQKIPSDISFLQSFLWRFILLRNLNISYPNTITKKELNFLIWTVSFESLTK